MLFQSERLRFRLLDERDKEQLFQIYSDKYAMRYRDSKPFEKREDADRMLMIVKKRMESGEEYRYGAELKEDSSLIGTVLFKSIRRESCEIGYSIGSDYWGKGLGVEMVNAMIGHLVQLNFKRVEATTRDENIASFTILEKAGFTRGPDRINGKEIIRYYFREL